MLFLTIEGDLEGLVSSPAVMENSPTQAVYSSLPKSFKTAVHLTEDVMHVCTAPL